MTTIMYLQICVYLGWLLLVTPACMLAAENTPTESIEIAPAALESIPVIEANAGLNIAQEVDARQSGFIDLSVDLEMVLRNQIGREFHRQLRVKILELEQGDKTLTVFDTPRDIRGTGLLTHVHKSKLDDQWLFLPGLKRVKKIASKNKSRPFVGSEFSFEDMSSPGIDKYTYVLLKPAACTDGVCYVLVLTPVDPYSGYSKLIHWIDSVEYRVLKTEYYDRRDRHIKTLTYDGYKLYSNRFWRPDSMRMINHITNNSTELIWRKYQFETGLNDNDFTQNSLKRVR